MKNCTVFDFVKNTEDAGKKIPFGLRKYLGNLNPESLMNPVWEEVIDGDGGELSLYNAFRIAELAGVPKKNLLLFQYESLCRMRCIMNLPLQNFLEYAEKYVYDGIDLSDLEEKKKPLEIDFDGGFDPEMVAPGLSFAYEACIAFPNIEKVCRNCIEAEGKEYVSKFDRAGELKSFRKYAEGITRERFGRKIGNPFR